MEVGEAVSPPSLVDLSDDCAFDHDVPEPPDVKNDLVGKGATLASSMSSGRSTKRYAPLAPDEASKVKWGKLPQKNSAHPFYKQGPTAGRCVTVSFPEDRSKSYPVSCSAHHLVPSQESLKDHPLLQYMCSKKDGAQDRNHSFGGGRVWSDVGYDTNGSENGVYLPGNYAVGGGTGGLAVWYPVDGEDDSEHDDGYIEPEKEPPEEYRNFLLAGVKGQISRSNPCWQYVAGATRVAKSQFHDRHYEYSEDLVKAALTAILTNYQRTDPEFFPEACSKCKDREDKIKKEGIPAPYTVVLRLQTISSRLRGYLKGGWRANVFTSKWMNNCMAAAQAGGEGRAAAELAE
jgi:hypothetical protein